MRAENSKYPHLRQFEIDLFNLFRVFIQGGLCKKGGGFVCFSIRVNPYIHNVIFLPKESHGISYLLLELFADGIHIIQTGNHAGGDHDDQF